MLEYSEFWLLFLFLLYSTCLKDCPTKRSGLFQTAAALCWGSAGAQSHSGLMFDGCIADRGELFVWGKNVRGCLGIGKRDDQYFPWRVRQHWFNISHANKRVKHAADVLKLGMISDLWLLSLNQNKMHILYAFPFFLPAYVGQKINWDKKQIFILLTLLVKWSVIKPSVHHTKMLFKNSSIC